MKDLSAILPVLQSQRALSREQMRAAMSCLLSGSADAGQTRDFLVLLAEKGETVDELAGAAQALRDSMIRVDVARRPVVDTCGTGGDGSCTFNISTASALALAACGVPVAKHGNRKISSSTGSADVLAELGIQLAAEPSVASRCLKEIGICFCFAPHFHPAMRHVAAIRQEIGQPTIFNRLGPLANPALAEHQLLGVGAEHLLDSMALALQRLGTLRSLVVRGEDGVDELSLSAASRVIEVTPSDRLEHRWEPADFGLERADRAELLASDPPASAACIRQVFAGEVGPKRDVVVMNAAAGLWLTGYSQDLRQCAQRVAGAIDTGDAQRLVERLAELTHA